MSWKCSTLHFPLQGQKVDRVNLNLFPFSFFFFNHEQFDFFFVIVFVYIRTANTWDQFIENLIRKMNQCQSSVP